MLVKNQKSFGAAKAVLLVLLPEIANIIETGNRCNVGRDLLVTSLPQYVREAISKLIECVDYSSVTTTGLKKGYGALIQLEVIPKHSTESTISKMRVWVNDSGEVEFKFIHISI